MLRVGVLALLALAAGVGLVLAAGPPLMAAVRRHPYFAVREVVVRNANRLAADDVRRAAGIAPGMSIWDVDVEAAADGLAALPSVRSARVRRELPHRIVIDVREERPAAILAVDGVRGGQFHVSARGRVIGPVPTGDARDLPYVTGLDPATLASGDRFGPHALRRALALARHGGGLEVSEVHVDRMRGLTLMPVRPAIPVELGWGGFDAKLERLARVLTLWAGREAEIAAVNCRFDDEIIVRTRTTERGGAPAARRPA
jgi:cell division protein FtsQ